MRNILIFCFTILSSLCFAQTDTMVVTMADGSIRGYPVSSINQITFNGTVTSIQEQKIVQQALSFTLHQNFPNPFNPSTTIQYNITKAGNVSVKIYDVQGRLICSLVHGFQQAGEYRIVWNSKNDAGGSVASGIYFYQIASNGSVLSKKMLLLK